MTGPLRILASALFFVAVPLALIFGNVRWLVFNEGHYLRGYDRYRVRETTGMSTEQLAQATREIQTYFRDGSPVTLRIRKETGIAPLFNDREDAHLRDVRSLLDLLFTVQAIATGYIPLYGALVHRWHRPRSLHFFAGEALGAGLFTVLLTGGMGALAATSFQQMFVQFHLLSFDNDLWMLDPRTDYMIRMFPEGFWFDSAMQVAGMTVAEALVLGAVGLLVRRREEPRAVAVHG